MARTESARRANGQKRFLVVIVFGGAELLAALIGPYKGNGNTSPKYGRSRNDRIPPSYKQGVAIGATVVVIEALVTFVGIAFFDMLSPRARQTVCDTGLSVGGIGFVVFTVVPGIHEHPEKRRDRKKREGTLYTSELQAYEDLLYRRKPKKMAE